MVKEKTVKSIPTPPKTPIVGNMLNVDTGAPLQSLMEIGRDIGPIFKLDMMGKPLIMAWGDDAIAGMEQAHFNGAPLDITVKPGANGPGEALPTGSMRVMTTSSLPVCSVSWPGPWPTTSALGECTRRYSNV